ncbi:hypothetical protein GCM10009544_23570 [Streptomyces stramineus]|uniref:Uncharacterized protein n=2 Tax=Streptomyces TaxID=1883 RepID=A0ABN0ZVD4_9ACTN
MKTHHRASLLAVSASLVIAGAGVAGAGAPASAASRTAALTCDAWRYERGGTGHHGASMTCYGSAFTSYVICHKPNGYMYKKFGNRAPSGGTSTAWCALNAEVVDAGAVPR